MERRLKVQGGIISIGVDREEVWFRIPLMNNRKRVGDRTDPRGTPLLIDLGEEQ